MSNDEKLRRAIADVLNADPASLTDASSPDTVAGWDSLAMVNLVAELEAAFGVEFDILEIAEFHTVGIIKSTLQDKGISF